MTWKEEAAIFDKEIEALKERNAKLVAALEEIANRAGNHADPDAAEWMPSIYKIARDALQQSTEKP